MHKARTSIALVVFAASCLCAKADLNWFLRPEMGRLDFPSRHYSNEPCYGIEIGRQFGPQGAHEVNLEWTRSNLEYSAFPDPKLIGGASIIASGHIQPILVGYRYYFGPAGSRLRFFAGPSFGMAKASVDVSYWADFSTQGCGYYVAADLNGPGGCPMTNIAPGIGYPTGRNNASVVWGPVQAIGIGSWFGAGVPTKEP